ncbi:MAG TPA: hypothetical protein VNB22_03920 [Pyrinomonadaceae bacterium]|nr:hypothetical protein [Pyrinomonadaceae bacterium]
MRLRVYAARRDLLEEIIGRIGKILPEGFYKQIPHRKAVHTFSVRCNKSAEYVLFKGRKKITFGNEREIFLKYLDWQIRLTIAEFAESRVFVHAGVVAWKGKAIILPAKSFQGKTTLVKELTKLGAKYYSDEYAVLDDEGFVHPFPKMLSIRGLGDRYQQTDYPVETFGGSVGVTPIPVGMVLLTEFESGAGWQPQILSDGLGVIELLSHTIPIRYNPKFSLKVLNKTVNRAIIVKTKRGEAEEFAVKLLSFFENKAF